MLNRRFFTPYVAALFFEAMIFSHLTYASPWECQPNSVRRLISELIMASADNNGDERLQNTKITQVLENEQRVVHGILSLKHEARQSCLDTAFPETTTQITFN